MIFDSHTHIHFPAYDFDRDEVIKRAQAAGVKMITVGTNLKTSKEGLALAKKYPNDIWATVGFHPSHVSDQDWFHDKKELREGVKEKYQTVDFKKIALDPKVVAIGECGLDYYRLVPERGVAESKDYFYNIKEEQKKVFIEQIKLAQELDKPLMIHCRPSKGTDDAYEDLLEILKPYTLNLIPKVIHFFVGSLEIAQRLLEAGGYFTFGGVITFVRDYDEVIKSLPLENIMLETDAPYVTPEPYRGRLNEPAYIIEVAKKLAEIKRIDYEEVVNQTTINAKKIFNI